MATNQQQIKVPQRSVNPRIENALVTVAKDGVFHRLFTMGFSSAEQTARSLNCGGKYEWGYTQDIEDGILVSVLWARWVG